MKLLPDINSPDDLRELSVEQLIELASEVRQEIVSTVATTGGHLASNLGSVELTLALHHQFETPKDRIIWDVSHQSYAHKLITGRKSEFRTIRQYQGLSGYCKREESQYDHFGAGHASTSISAALGFAAARDLHGLDHKVIAVIGDGAMTGGLAFEAMNNAGSLKKDLLVILNDNTWSISKNVGSISKYLTSIMADEKFNKLRSEIWELTGRFKRRELIRETVKRLEKSVKGLLVPGMLFEKFGFRYFGPIDGHDLPLLVRTLRDLKNLSGPVLLHVATVKGKGYKPSEEDAYKYHGVGKFDKLTGQAAATAAALPSYTKVFGKIMVELAEKDDKVNAITAAMSSGTGLDSFGEKFPDRFFDVGIAEAHAACFAAGLAAEGAKPYLTVYSTFMQRAYDQVIHDMAIQKLPVVICMDRAGLVGNDGPTHHGAFDIAYLSAVPNVTLAAPKDGNEFRSMLHHTADHPSEGIVAIRYPRDSVPTPMEDQIHPIQWGTWEWCTEPSPVVALAVGTMVHQALAAAEILVEEDIELSVVNARFIKPFDFDVLEKVRHSATHLITIEEGCLNGGFGQAVAGYLLSRQSQIKFSPIALPDAFVTHGSRGELLAEIGLDAESLAGRIARFVSNQSEVASADSEVGFLKRLVFRRNGLKRKKSIVPSTPTGTDYE